MKEIVECVPNFSTSDPKVVEQILNELRSTRNAFLLDYTFDSYYNRLVISFIGTRRSVLEAMMKMASKAIELIDMRTHKGQHPRIGAVDVVPFVPLEKVTIEDCIRLARKFGKMLSEEHKVPVYLYGEAATRPERRDLDWIREGEFERLAEMMQKPGRKPDFGPRTPHPTAGATAVGARRVMVGFNVNLGTSDLKIAKKIAKALHLKSGGLSNVKAMAAFIPEKNITQIGMSILDFEKTPLYRVFELLRIEALRYNVPVISSEFCGLVPLKAILDAASYYLRIDNLEANKVLEVAVYNAIKGRKNFE